MAEDIVGASKDSERRCAYAGCTTRLSMYNSDFLCWTHADARTRAHFERTTARPAFHSDRWAPRAPEPERGSRVYQGSEQRSPS